MIICAAIKLKCIHSEQEDDELIVCGLRHGNCLEVINEFKTKVGFSHQTQGFIDDKGNFLNRYEAYLHACQCGQLSKTTRLYKEEKGETELYSEDLY